MQTKKFQYPLFRIVDCFYSAVMPRTPTPKFQYPLFRIVDCFKQRYQKDVATLRSFNIRSFGSWIASPDAGHYHYTIKPVSISALSDRGLLPSNQKRWSLFANGVSISALSDRGLLLSDWIVVMVSKNMFQYPLFRIVDCFRACCAFPVAN